MLPSSCLPFRSQMFQSRPASVLNCVKACSVSGRESLEYNLTELFLKGDSVGFLVAAMVLRIQGNRCC
jgi:hypothetical protein